MSLFPDELPALDCHAHIAPDVTDAQIGALKGAVVFAMTRTPAETTHALRRQHHAGLGQRRPPRGPAALKAFQPRQFATTLKQTCLIRGSRTRPPRQPPDTTRGARPDSFDAARDEPVILSLHSNGRTGPLLDLLTSRPHPGIILHWFLGSVAERKQAISLGAYFSPVNAAMLDDTLSGTTFAPPAARDRLSRQQTRHPARPAPESSTRWNSAAGPAPRHDPPADQTPGFWQNLRELTTRTQVLRPPAGTQLLADWALEA